MPKPIAQLKISSFSALLSSLSFLGVLLCLTRQFPFNFLSLLLSVFLLFAVFTHIYFNHKRNSGLNLLDAGIFVGFLGGILGYSLMQGNEPGLVIRFFVILFLINVVLLFRFGNVTHLTIFKYVYLLQAIILIGMGIGMPLFFDVATYGAVRHLFLGNDWGDIYTHNGIYYRVQVIGNALIPIFFFLSYIRFRESERQHRLLLSVSFLACVFAGNLAYFLAVFLFCVLYEVSKLGALGRMIDKYKFLLTLAATVLLPVFLYYVFNLVLMKSSGDTSSIGTRFDQINVLLGSMSTNLQSLLFGNGLGHTLNIITPYRDYTGDIYFELQALYFLNQLGFVPFTLLFLFHIYLFLKAVRSFNCRLVYFVYLIYASVNPYFLDSSHVVVLILLLAYNAHEESTYQESSK